VLSISSKRFRNGRFVWLWILASAGCASTGPELGNHGVAELTEVPFFAQTAYDCGPAALATLLNTADVEVTPADLIDRVYIDGLRGSLQAELLAATRRYGLLPVPVSAGLPGLVAEIESGRPVLVMQNLGFERAPVWHYAVVVGFDAEAGRIILRSGSEPRHVMSTRRFARSWKLAENWGFVAVRVGEVPESAGSGDYVRALVGSQRQLGTMRAAIAYEAALERWPDDELVLFLAATHEYSSGDLHAAEALYRKLIFLHPEHVAARNNLANILLEQGCRDEALSAARAGLSYAPSSSEFHAALMDTLSEIEASAQTSIASTAVCNNG